MILFFNGDISAWNRGFVVFDRIAMRNIPRSSRPRIWCPKEDYRAEDGISMSASSGSSSYECGKQMETVVHWDTRGTQEGDLYVLEPSKLVIVDSKLARYSIR